MTAAAFAFCAAPAAVRADGAALATVPITVSDCHPDNHFLTFDMTFTNVAPKTVTKVRFALTNLGGPFTMIDDVGNYASGNIVRHRYRVSDLRFLRIYSDTTCVPTAVTFQDGTTWENPSVSPDLEKDFVQTPGSQIAISRCLVPGGLEMSWKNLAQQDATEVDIGLVQHGVLVFETTDKGTFSPGTLIEHEYYDAPGGSGKGYFVADDMMQNRCIVLGVKYADGTSWANPSAPQLSKDGVPFADAPDPGPNAPVTITGCDGKSSSDWHVDYQNSSTKPIVATDFALIMHGKIDDAARDLHNLAPGDGSTARFVLYDNNVFHPACIPLRVNYADGTVWYNPLFAPGQTAAKN